MPEGPEVKTIAHELAKQLSNKTLASPWLSSYPLRKKIDIKELTSLKDITITTITSHGKNLFFIDRQMPILHFQLGMTGQLIYCHKNDEVKKHTHLRWPIKNMDFEIRYIDPRRFGAISICDNKIYKKILASLGPDPFHWQKSDLLSLAKKITAKRSPIKDIILDQKMIAGVGNIYASEALFLAGIHPSSKGCDLDTQKTMKLLQSIETVLRTSFKNKGTTFSNYVTADNKKGDNFNHLYVFMREKKPCSSCRSPILRIKQSGRSTFYCPKCQTN